MNFKRLFWFELITGIIILFIPILAVIAKFEIFRTRESNIYILSLLTIISTVIYRKPAGKTDWERMILKKTGFITGFLLGFPAIIFLMNIKNYNSGLTNIFGPNWVFFLYSYFLLIHSIFGFFILSRNPKPVDIPELFRPEGTVAEQPEYLKILSYSSLLLIIFCGIGIFAFCLFCIADGSSVNEALMIPVFIIIIITLTNFVNAKIHNLKILDERERHLIFKITSITAFLSLIILMVLFACKDYYIFGYLISDVWGLAIVPLGMFIWGITGLAVLAIEEGDIQRILKRIKTN